MTYIHGNWNVKVSVEIWQFLRQGSYVVMWHDASGIARNLVGCTWLPWTTWMFFPFLEPLWKLDLWSHLENTCGDVREWLPSTTWMSSSLSGTLLTSRFGKPFERTLAAKTKSNSFGKPFAQTLAAKTKSNSSRKVTKKLVEGQTLSRSEEETGWWSNTFTITFVYHFAHKLVRRTSY